MGKAERTMRRRTHWRQGDLLNETPTWRLKFRRAAPSTEQRNALTRVATTEFGKDDAHAKATSATPCARVRGARPKPSEHRSPQPNATVCGDVEIRSANAEEADGEERVPSKWSVRVPKPWNL